jgi:SAM-dependent methyltransferase
VRNFYLRVSHKILRSRWNFKTPYQNKFVDAFLNRSFDLMPSQVDFHLSPTDKQRLFDRIERAWNSFGENEPHWSVLTHKKFSKKKIKANLDEFYSTGRENAHMLISSLFRLGLSNDQLTTFKCVELGCGVGRISLSLSDFFSKVEAYDISNTHLEILKKVVDERGISNIQLHKMSSMSNVTFGTDNDLFYSLITLQHNPPPIQLDLISAGIQSLKPGGFFYFQLPTHIPGYSFNLKEYLATSEGQMEMHAVPPEIVTEHIENCGGVLRSMIRDNMTGHFFDSYTFIGVKN